MISGFHGFQWVKRQVEMAKLFSLHSAVMVVLKLTAVMAAGIG